MRSRLIFGTAALCAILSANATPAFAQSSTPKVCVTNKSNFALEANVITRRPNISRSTGIYVPVNLHYCVDLYPTETADKVWIRPIPGSETPYPVGQPNWQGIYNAVVTGTALSYQVEWR